MNMTVWMDFNPLSYVGVNHSISVGGNVSFELVWIVCGCGFYVVLAFEGCHVILYEHVYLL